MNKLLGMPDNPYVDVECDGKLDTFMLFTDLSKANELLQQYGCRPIVSRDRAWKFDTALPQEVRDAMKEGGFSYAVTQNTPEGTVFFYIPGLATLAIKLKYLKLFAAENVEVEIDGKIYSYCMTNDEKALDEKLWKCGCLRNVGMEWKVNYALHKHVTDKMSELGAIYSMTFSNDVSVLNWYYMDVPYIIRVDQLAKLTKKKVMYALWNKCIKDDDVESLKKLAKSKKDLDKTLILSWTPLMLAAAYNSQKCAKLLIKLGVNVDAATKDCVTALMVAAGKGSTEMVKILLKAGADKTIRAKNGWTAYVNALANNYEEIASLLSEEGNVEQAEWQNEKLPFHDRLGFFIARFTALGDHKVCDVYKNLKGYMSRQTFSKLQTNIVHPSKRNVILLAIGLRLSVEDAETLLLSAGYNLSEKEDVDMVVKQYLQNRNYNIFKMDAEIWKKTHTSFLAKPRGKERR